jgi:hypothetical protein
VLHTTVTAEGGRPVLCAVAAVDTERTGAENEGEKRESARLDDPRLQNAEVCAKL